MHTAFFALKTKIVRQHKGGKGVRYTKRSVSEHPDARRALDDAIGAQLAWLTARRLLSHNAQTLTWKQTTLGQAVFLSGLQTRTSAADARARANPVACHTPLGGQRGGRAE